jgi:hypothetical protein
MTRQTFILIVTIYGFLLALSMVFLSADAVKYFGGNPDNIQEVGLMQYLGVAHLGFNFIGLNLRKSTDSQSVRAYLIGVAIVTFGALVLALYNVFGKNLPIHPTAYIDWGLWAILGLGALYFWSKEK